MIGQVDFTSIVTTENLPSRVSTVISAAATEQLMEVKNLRKLCFIDRVEGGDKTYVYYSYDALTAAYDRGSEVEDWKYDDAAATEHTGDMVELAKGFQLSWKADHLKKLSVRAAQTKAAVREVQDREDYKIVTALIASGAVTSSVSGTAVLSSTSADPVLDLDSAKRAVRALGYEPDTLFIENTNLSELTSIIGSNDWYEMTARAILAGETDKFMGLKLVALPSTKLTHGTAVVAKTGPAGVLQLGVAEDLTLKIFDDEENHTTKVQVFETVCPVVTRPDAGAKITGW